MLELLGLQQDRHAVVALGDELIRLGDDHGAGLQTFAGLFVLPLIPQARDRQYRGPIHVQ